MRGWRMSIPSGRKRGQGVPGQGWLNYHAVPGNSDRIGRFVDEVLGSGCMLFGVAANAVARAGHGNGCTVWCVATYRVPASFILIQTNGFASGSRQEP